MNILAIDYGKKRIGLAWMQSGINVVLPFGVIEEPLDKPMVKEKGKRFFVSRIISLIKDESIDKIVFGLPIGLDGKENESTERVKDFVKELKKEIDIPIEFVDERFTSREADRMGGEASRDEKAAMLILQSYLEKS